MLLSPTETLPPDSPPIRYISIISPRDSASSDDSVAEDFADPAGAFQARKRRALKKYGNNHRFDMVNNDDDISDISMSQREILDMIVSQEETSDDSPAGDFQARKKVALKKYGHKGRSMLFADDLTEIATRSESTSSSESTFSNNKKRRSSSVRFTTVSIRSFDRAVGDHPCCKEGPALTLDWDYQQQADISVETYETTRKPTQKRLFPCERSKILAVWSKEEVSSARKQRLWNKLAKLFRHKL